MKNNNSALQALCMVVILTVLVLYFLYAKDLLASDLPWWMKFRLL